MYVISRLFNDQLELNNSIKLDSIALNEFFSNNLVKGQLPSEKTKDIPLGNYLHLTNYQKLNFKCLAIFGTVLLDQFIELLEELIKTNHPEYYIQHLKQQYSKLPIFEKFSIIAKVFPSLKRYHNDICWLYLHMKSIRNSYFIHPDFRRSNPGIISDSECQFILDLSGNPISCEADINWVRSTHSNIQNHFRGRYCDEGDIKCMITCICENIETNCYLIRKLDFMKRLCDVTESIGYFTPSYHDVCIRLLNQQVL